VDLDGDGMQEIVVPQNKDENGVIAVVYRTAAGIRFQQVNSGFEGIIGGFGAIPSDDGGPPTLITSVIRYHSLLKAGGQTQIIMTNPPLRVRSESGPSASALSGLQLFAARSGLVWQTESYE
jgi:hypothetical protein